MRDLLSVPAMRPPGSPRRGFLAGSIERPRGSAPRERDHRGGDHPVPSRTRQLSPPSPRVLQREAAGGQGVALAEGAFLYAPFERRPPTGRRSLFPGRARGGAPADAGGVRRMRRERPAGGIVPLRAFSAFGCRKMLRFSLYALREIVVGLTGAYLEFGTMKSHNLVTLTQRGNA